MKDQEKEIISILWKHSFKQNFLSPHPVLPDTRERKGNMLLSNLVVQLPN